MSKIIILSFFLLNLTSALGQELFGLENSNEHIIRAKLLNTSNDPDVLKALSRGTFNNQTIYYTVISFKDLNGVSWLLQVFENKSKSGPTFFIPHDNENDSFQVGAKAIRDFGGHLISLECKERRFCKQGVDPNRYFKSENLLFTSTIMRFFEAKSYPVITLHNNHDSHRSLGGRGVIYADMDTPYTDGFGHYFVGDADDLIIYADSATMNDSYVYQRYATLFRENLLNNIFEFVRPESSLSGHMSSFVLNNSNLEYFNIEAQHEHEKTQHFYLKALLSLLSN